MRKFVIFSFLMMVIFTSCYNQLHLQLVLFYSDDNQIVTMQAVKYGEKVKEPNNPEKTGYTFNGWYTSSDFSKEFDFNTKIVGETHIYAKFDINKYNIHFESNSETVIDDVIVDYGSLLERPEELEKECCLFDGWYTDQEFNKEYNFDAIVIQDLTLYAKWNDNHAYDEGVITKEATCTEDGIKKYTCKKCGEEKEETLSATGHNYNGVTCTVCGHKLVDSLAELNHEYTDDNGLVVCLTSFTHTEIDGYNDYEIIYVVTNNVYGSELLPGTFRLVYRLSDGSLHEEWQNGFFNYLYYGEQENRRYKWRLTSEKEFLCLVYIPYGASYSDILSDELLHWSIE